MYFTTTSKPVRYYSKRKGTTRAERRLQRDLADKDALLSTVAAFRDVIVELEHSAVNNPIVGFVLSGFFLSIAHKFRLLSDTEFTLLFAGIGLLELSSAASNVGSALAGDLGAIAQFIPSVGAKSLTVKDQNSLIAGNATAITESRGQPNATSVGSEQVVSEPKP